MSGLTEPAEAPTSLHRSSAAAVLLALGTSSAVLLAAAAGAVTGTVVVGALLAATVIAGLGFRPPGGREMAELLRPLAQDAGDPAVVAAPRASEVRRPGSHSDAAPRSGRRRGGGWGRERG